MNSEDKFNLWLTFIPDYLYFFLEDVPELSKELDYSLESLYVLEKYILDNFPTVGSMLEEKNKIWRERFAIYFGEVIVKNAQDAIWKLQTKEKFIYFGTPVIVRESVGLEDSPYASITAAIDRNKGDYLYTSAKSFVEYKGPTKQTKQM